MLYGKTFLGAGLSLLSLSVVSADTTIVTSVRNAKTNARLGTDSSLTTIRAGVYYWLSGFSTHNIDGNVNNYGSIIISQTDSTVAKPGGQTVDWSGSSSTDGNLVNNAGASISLNDVSAVSAPTYDWNLYSMQNDGSIQFCGRGDTGGSTYQLYCRANCVNNGLIDFSQVYGNLGTAAVWRNPTLTPGTKAAVQSITHNGGFLMRSMRVDFVQNFQGTGCWMIGNNAVMYLQDGTGYYQNKGFGPALAGQSISFLDGTGVLHLDTKVYSLNSAFGPQIYGFGQGNGFEFYETIKSVAYSGQILQITLSSGNVALLKIGTGYNTSGFSVAKRRSNYANYNTVYYNAAAPASSPPTQCSLTSPVCQALTGPPVQSSSSLSVNSASSTVLSTAQSSLTVETSTTSSFSATTTADSSTSETDTTPSTTTDFAESTTAQSSATEETSTTLSASATVDTAPSTTSEPAVSSTAEATSTTAEASTTEETSSTTTADSSTSEIDTAPSTTSEPAVSTTAEASTSTTAEASTTEETSATTTADSSTSESDTAPSTTSEPAVSTTAETSISTTAEASTTEETSATSTADSSTSEIETTPTTTSDPAVSTTAESSASDTTSTTLSTSTITTADSSTSDTNTTPTTTSDPAVSSTLSQAPIATETGSFYLKSSCDKSCLGHFGSDYQTYSNAFTSTDNTYDLFHMSGDNLYMTSTGNLCVASQAGGSHTRLQCSNDVDWINGSPVPGGFGTSDTALTYQSVFDWAGCGVLDLANNYEPTGLTYSADGTTVHNCRACTLTKVYDIAACRYSAKSST